MMRQVALITGASSGLGLELAVRIAAERTVVGVSRQPPSDLRWHELLLQSVCHHVRGSVAEPATAARAYEEADRLGALDLVVNCAGCGVFGAAGSYTRLDIDEALEANLIGLILFSEAAYARFRATGGTIVNVMSTAAHVSRVNEAVYCAAKWGARGYSEVLRLEARESSVRVLCVYPGGMNTDFWQRARGANVDPAEFMRPESVARSILEALSDPAEAWQEDLVIRRDQRAEERM